MKDRRGVVVLIVGAALVLVTGAAAAASTVPALLGPAVAGSSGVVAERGAQVAFDAPPPPLAQATPTPYPQAAHPPPQTAPSIVEGCVPVDPSPVDAWRTERGLAPFVLSDALTAEACEWSLHLATIRRLVHGDYNEVLFSGSRPEQAFSAWWASPPHVALLVSADPRVTEIGCGAVRAIHPDGTRPYYVTCRMSF